MFDMAAIFHRIGEVFASSGYWMVPLATFLESAVIISLAAPGLIILLLAGYFAGQGALWLPFVMILAITGTLVGSNTSYLLGRFFWSRFSSKHRIAQKVDQVGRIVINRTMWFLPFYHFSGYGRALVPLAAGALRMPLTKWVLFDIIGAAAWSVAFSLLGYLAGSYGTNIEAVFKRTDLIEWTFSGLLVLWIVAVGLTARRIVAEIRRTKVEPPSFNGR